MTADTHSVVEDLEKLVAELEAVAAHMKDAPRKTMGGRIEEAAAGVQSMLDAAQRRVSDLQTELERRVRKTTAAANETILENAWGAVAVGAAAALLLGFALARGSAGPERAPTPDDTEHPH